MKRAFPALLALLCATLALLIATSSSPLYAANFWTDTNIYFTIGRGFRIRASSACSFWRR